MTTEAIEGLRANHEDLGAVLAQVDDDQWASPSACEGWRVQDVLAHVTSNFKELADPSPPPAEPPPELPAEEMVELLVTPRRGWTAAEVMAEYTQHLDGALAVLESMQSDPVASTESQLADLGTYQMHWLANAYCFDHYCHLRHDLLAPSGPLALDVPEADDIRVRPGIDWMLAGLPQMCTDALAIVDRPLGLELTGAGGGHFTLHPAGDDGLISIVESADDAAATATSSAHDFVSWGTQRSNWRETTTVRGDEGYAASVLDVINII